MLCVAGCGAGENSVRLLRFGVNGSFYLNAEKFSVSRLVQNLTSLPTSCIQIAYKLRTSSVHQTCIDVVEKSTTWIRCRGLHRKSLILY